LTIPTVRAWERRYGVVQPSRTPTGYRLYDDDAITRLIAMRYLVDGLGIRPRQAAEQMLAGGAALDEALAASRAWWGRGGPTPSVQPDEAGAGTTPNAVGAFVTAARGLDVASLEETLDEAFAAERFESAMENVVFPALRAIGDGWLEGSIDVAMEHAASEVVRRRLARFYDAAVAVERRPDVVVGLPPGSHHDIGVLAFAVASRRAGLSVMYLGADVPVESWVLAVASTAAPVAVLGVTSLTDTGPAAAVVAALRAVEATRAVRLGGASAGRVAGVTPDDILPERMAEAVAVVSREVAPSRHHIAGASNGEAPRR
jgi:methanogenic corrinoid protein MtbC1